MGLVTCDNIGDDLTEWLQTATTLQKETLCEELGCSEEWLAANSDSITVSGDGSESNPYSFSLILSPDEGNSLEVRNNGVYAPPQGDSFPDYCSAAFRYYGMGEGGVFKARIKFEGAPNPTPPPTELVGFGFPDPWGPLMGTIVEGDLPSGGEEVPGVFISGTILDPSEGVGLIHLEAEGAAILVNETSGEGISVAPRVATPLPKGWLNLEDVYCLSVFVSLTPR